MSETYRHLPSREMPINEGVMVGVAEIPSRFIIGSHINPLAADLLEGDARKMATEEFMVKSVRFSVPLNRATESIWATYCQGRSFPIAYGVFRYGGMIGTVVQQKGTGFSGARYLQFNDISSNTNDFCGLENRWDADGDIQVSNLLIANKSRMALPLGYIALDDVKLERWLCEQWKDAAFDYASVIQNIFEKLRDLKYQPPVALFRIGGALQRLTNTLYADETQPETYRYHLHLGALTMLTELENKEPMLTNVVALSQLPYQRVLQMLTHVFHGIPLDDNHIYCYHEFLSALAAQNAKAVHQATKAIDPYAFDASQLSLTKDVDTAMFAYDGDTSWLPVEDKKDASTNAQLYIENARYVIRRYFELLIWAQLIPPDHIPSMITINEAIFRMYDDIKPSNS